MCRASHSCKFAGRTLLCGLLVLFCSLGDSRAACFGADQQLPAQAVSAFIADGNRPIGSVAGGGTGGGSGGQTSSIGSLFGGTSSFQAFGASTANISTNYFAGGVTGIGAVTSSAASVRP